jgi:hypothetical protein
MKQIARFDLVDKIGRALQAKMTFDDIDAYLAGFGVEQRDGDRSYNSKWVYAKDRLREASDDIVIRIADELEIPHAHVVVPGADVGDSRFWEAGHFRLFLSHLATFKASVARLQRALKPYGISSFVAHVDIDPTREWQLEIERALFSMDALVAVLMPGFKESNWTDQEVGVAVGRGVPVIPIMKGLNPYGFIAKYQGFDVGNRTVGEVARSVFEILLGNERTSNKMWTAFVDGLLLAGVNDDVDERLEILESLTDWSRPHLERLREGAAENSLLTTEPYKGRMNAFLRARNMPPISIKTATELRWDGDDDLPF